MTGRRKKGGGRVYRGQDWRDRAVRPAVGRADVLLFCDLRGCDLGGSDLTGVEFFGCLLNGASFRGARLAGAKFVACFSAEGEDPTDFQGAAWEGVTVADSHLNVLTDEGGETAPGAGRRHRWPDPYAEVFADALSKESGLRYRAAERLGQLGATVTAPCLARLLTDGEWEVRAVTLQTLAGLRGARFPYRDRDLLEWMFLSLGDESPVVEQTAVGLARAISPGREVLQPAVDRVASGEAEEILKGLRAAYNLCRLGEQYTPTLDAAVVQGLTSHPSPEVRVESVQLLGCLDLPAAVPAMLERLSDPLPSVRVEALRSLASLSEPPPAEQFVSLLDDEDENVRRQVLYSMEQTGNILPEHLTRALLDSSANVRRTAKRMLEEYGL